MRPASLGLLVFSLLASPFSSAFAPPAPPSSIRTRSVIADSENEADRVRRGGAAAAVALAATSPSAASLAVHFGVDAASAGLTALCVAPLITAFDEAITRSASGEDNLWTALGSRLRGIMADPVRFFLSPAFKWMWLVYACTYFVANGLKNIERASGINFGFAATLAVTVVNMCLGIAKDSAYSKMFSGSEDGGDRERSAAATTPASAYVTWFLRDVTAFSFILTLPPMIASAFPRMISLDLAKFTAPIIAQYVTTVLHLVGFNLCRSTSSIPGAGGFDAGETTTGGGERTSWLKMPTYWSTVAARQMRIIPPYSIGGVLNGKLVSSAPLLAEMITGIAV